MTLWGKFQARQALCWALILQILVSPVVARATPDAESEAESEAEQFIDRAIEEGAQDDETRTNRADLERFLSAIEASDSQDAPAGEARDPFHLAGQKLELIDAKTGTSSLIDLSRPNLEVPSVAVSVFAKDVRMSANRETREIAFERIKNGGVIARHILKGFDVAAAALDANFAQFITTDGRIYAIDLGAARAQVFEFPIPVHEVWAPTEGSILPAALSRGRVSVEFIKRKTRAPDLIAEGAVLPTDVHEKSVWTAGDFAVFIDKPSGERELLGVYDRGVTALQVATGSQALEAIARLALGQGGAKDLAQASDSLKDPLVAQAATDNDLDPLAREAILAYPPELVATLGTRARVIQEQAGKLRDRFTRQEWEEGPPVAPDAKSAKNVGLVSRILRSKGLRWVAWLSGAATVAAGSHQLLEGHGPDFAVSTALWIYQHAWPSVLKDRAYRVTLLKSCLALWAYIPAIALIGKAVAKLTRSGLPATKAAMTLGVRIYAAFMRPFLAGIARLALQKNFVLALKAGMNPFARIAADSAVGRAAGMAEDARAGVNSVFVSGEHYENEVSMKRHAIEAVAAQKARLRSYSWVLAAIVVGQQNGIDPATLFELQKARADGQTIEAVAQPEFRKQWTQTAREVGATLASLRGVGAKEDLRDLTPAQIAEDYATALRIAEEARNRTPIADALARLRMAWRSFSENALGAIGRFGEAEHRFLSEVELSDEVAGMAWRMFAVDHGLCVPQMGVTGPRADLADPANLAADENGIFWTNRDHWATAGGEEIATYSINSPAGTALVYQKENVPEEAAYAPIEKETLTGSSKTSSFFGGLFTWARGLLNLKEMGVGYFIVRDQIRGLRTIQAAFITSMIVRMAVAHRGPREALAGFLLMIGWNMWAYRWFWHPINRGNQRYEEKIAGQAAAFENAKTKIGQGLRTKDLELMNEGYDELARMYADHSDGGVPKELRTALKSLETVLNTPEKERISEADVPNPAYLGALARLKQALEEGNGIDHVTEAYHAVRTLYRSDAAHVISELNARSLLDFALEHPPFATEAHPRLTWATTMIGSVVTTYWYNFISVASFAPDQLTAGAMGKMFATSAGLFTAAYFGQKLIDRVAGWFGSGSKAPEREPLSAYLDRRAKEFRITPQEVSARLTCSALLEK